MIKELISSGVDMVKENKLITGAIAVGAIGAVVFYKRKALVQKYNELKEKSDLAKKAYEFAATEEERETSINVEAEEVKGAK